ncbi:threonine synthase [Paenibacillus polygoni]|uniref:Threonine synthase n=1 Tax=Paenibacillus polygoni TaxID=3050112 RepID=A0ABY8X4S1_9BACL|nr:threonine synthase [Paenibacillus polygoni]WIV20511.1 threonine synthase [Paenibacillus polygoni]
MQYQSTRGQVSEVGFIDAFLMGLATDGGLLVPSTIPVISSDKLEEWRTLSFQDLMLEIFSYYLNEEIPNDELKEMIYASYSTFRHEDVTPVHQLTDDIYLLELFHGPTFAFKDIALQLMGQLYSYVAKKYKRPINILGATSGDTGASAIQGVRGKEGINICILHPNGKVSKVQELQMTTVQDENVLNLSVEGNFDDCQRMIKELFADVNFKNEHHLCAINSINIVRILAQTVYYFYAYFRVTDQRPELKGVPLHFSVPTGNFGDIFAGYLASRMGLPVGKLVLATNENNILERFVKEGIYKPDGFHTTYSPSMDIQVASNFERYLYYVLDEDAEQTESYMKSFQESGEIRIPQELLSKVQSEFAAYGVIGAECLATIQKYNDEKAYLLDPHSACGVAAAERTLPAGEVVVSLATAHPAKFNESIELCEIKQEFPPQISALYDMPVRKTEVEGTLDQVVAELIPFYHRLQVK